MQGAAVTNPPLLAVQDLQTRFFRPGGEVVRAVDGLSYQLAAGEAVAIVGESGSGKSVSVRSLLGLLPPAGRVVGGEAWFGGQDLLKLPERALRRVRGREIAMVFQDAMTALNPTFTIQRQLIEPLLWHDICRRAEARERALKALADVGMDRPELRLRQYPFQLSGGMRQRAMIAMALVTQPKLLIADEPTTALDVTLQRQILDIFKTLKERGMAIIMITHDLGVARYFCDSVVVMYAGKVMERGPVAEFIEHPRHPYSRGLLESTLEVGQSARRLAPIAGSPPDLAHRPSGCPFHPRCALAEERCRHEEQTLESFAAGREAACWKVTEGAKAHATGGSGPHQGL
ncbi:MAG: ABC transporter ATP-binding protein [Thermomicrobiales bacterium]